MIEIKKNNNNKETDLPSFKHGIYIDDIIWPRRDGKILLVLKKNFFSTREEKFRISKRPCNVLFIT